MSESQKCLWLNTFFFFFLSDRFKPAYQKSDHVKQKSLSGHSSNVIIWIMTYYVISKHISYHLPLKYEHFTYSKHYLWVIHSRYQLLTRFFSTNCPCISWKIREVIRGELCGGLINFPSLYSNKIGSFLVWFSDHIFLPLVSDHLSNHQIGIDV